MDSYQRLEKLKLEGFINENEIHVISQGFVKNYVNYAMSVLQVLSEFDIFVLVGVNKPVHLVDSRVLVKEDGMIVTRFEEVLGSPMVSEICIRRAPELFESHPTNEFLRYHSCTSHIEVPLALAIDMQQKTKANYEKKIEDLTIQVQRKKEECLEAWMSLVTANQQLEKIRSELDMKFIDTFSQGFQH